LLREPPQHLRSEELFKEGDHRKISELEAELDRVRDELALAQDATERLREGARIDIQNLQTDIVAKNREVAALKRELKKAIDPESDEGREVKGLLDLWWREVMNSDPRVHHGLDSTRAPKVRAAIARRKKGKKGGGDYGGLDICRRAILGVRYDDWAMGRVAKSHGKSFCDIAEHILNTDGDIEKFAKLYDANFVPAPEVYRRMIAEGLTIKRKPPIEIALEGLRQLGCDSRESTTPGQWVAQCPLHENTPWTLYVRTAYGRCRMLCSHGCDEYTLLMAAGFTGPSDWQESAHPATEQARIDDQGRIVTDQGEA
jgi:hypothetical protein